MIHPDCGTTTIQVFSQATIRHPLLPATSHHFPAVHVASRAALTGGAERFLCVRLAARCQCVARLAWLCFPTQFWRMERWQGCEVWVKRADEMGGSRVEAASHVH
mmetsp:Transcript_37744/g.84131  ORF Transcript_37744/g.84131 Transcript_37744/m.84131 type:complete len:105 (-) Transcript_37744:856-1170(-)